MDFETFKENLTNDVKEKLYERYSTEVEVGSHRTEKMNETYDALTVKPVDSFIIRMRYYHIKRMISTVFLQDILNL